MHSAICCPIHSSVHWFTRSFVFLFSLHSSLFKPIDWPSFALLRGSCSAVFAKTINYRKTGAKPQYVCDIRFGFSDAYISSVLPISFQQSRSCWIKTQFLISFLPIQLLLKVRFASHTPGTDLWRWFKGHVPLSQPPNTKPSSQTSKP